MLSDELQEWLINYLGAYGELMESLGRLGYFQALREMPEFGMYFSSNPLLDKILEELKYLAEKRLILAARYKEVLRQQAPKILEEVGDNISELEDICYKIITS